MAKRKNKNLKRGLQVEQNLSLNSKANLKVSDDCSNKSPTKSGSPKEAFLKMWKSTNQIETINAEAETTINNSFESLKDLISEETMKAIKEMNFSCMTEIQAKCIPKLLNKKDVRGTAKTGSGKTLAFLIPVVEHVVKLRYNHSHGLGALIISPTRELTLQIYKILQDLLKPHKQTCTMIVGGENINKQSGTLIKGVNVVVATPGRLLDHLENTEFKFDETTFLVIDEADRICDIGFERDLKKIISILPKERQTALFSATNDSRTDNITSLALQNSLVEIDVDNQKTLATNEGLKQEFVVCPVGKRISLLVKMITEMGNKKGMIFFNTCNVVRFFDKILTKMKLPVLSIHGRRNQNQRTCIFNEFNKAESGILLCTNVASRGWDIPAVDWILQFEVPEEPKEYIHRVGRTARAGKEGKAILFILESEAPFLMYLKQAKVIVEKKEVDWSKVEEFENKVLKLVGLDSELKKAAEKAFKAFVRCYKIQKMNDVFNFESLNLDQVARDFGLRAQVKNIFFQHQPGKKRKMNGKNAPQSKKMKKK